MEQKRKTTKERIDESSTGVWMAFKVRSVMDGGFVAEKMYSGELIEKQPDKLTFRTKNGSIYFAAHEDVTWVLEEGGYYPSGIYNAIRMSNKQTP
jgi:hypothetical protein